MKSIHDVLDEFRAAALNERDKGDLFEKLVRSFLQTDPTYAGLFKDVWLYSDWAEKQGLQKVDTGIDLVAQYADDDEFAAIQCKFYAEGSYLDKRELDSFFTASGKKPFVSRFIFSTTDNWSKHAEDAIHDQQIPVTRIRVADLDDSLVDWSSFSLNDPTKLGLKARKSPFPHQIEAIEAAKKHFKDNSRGKLIMACGTGKTYTSLQIVEELTPKGGTVLFLVPSIALLSQTLREWKNEAVRDFRAYAVCSDSKVGKRKNDEGTSVPDLAYPATTDTKRLSLHFKSDSDADFTVIFSTYQSIEVVAKAQSNGVPEFDLIICDEAHRTTGVTLSGNDESSFVRVHDNDFIRGKKRLYMTATPRIFAEASKSKADEADAVLASMDDETLYGDELYRLNFGQAVSRGLLSDYKVLVLAVSEEHVSKQLQKLLARNGEIELNDAIKIVGCYNGLRKRSDGEESFIVDPEPMKTAVAFARSIKDSKRIAELFEVVTTALNKEAKEPEALIAQAEHVDGTFNILARNQKLDWLKDTDTKNSVRVLSNARCLSEGVDVPALDAVMFLNPRDSQVDVVQSVGRVMRKSPGKQYGYVILPITVPAGQSPEEVLSDNKAYKVVWQVLQALRSHDERFDALVNKIDLTGNSVDSPIQIINVGIGEPGNDEPASGEPNAPREQLSLWHFDDFRDAIFAKIVQKVGQRTYWENWAKDVAEIAKNHISRITQLVDGADGLLAEEFEHFLKGLQDNLNPYVKQKDAVEMLAQHLITKPVFDALFEGYAFTDTNPVSMSMNRMTNALRQASINLEQENLEGFYESVRLRASGITDGGAKQKIIKELYEKFFRLAFAETSDKLGIVYTPNEIVDFIINSVNDVLQMEFGVGLGEQGIHVLDPFTGTGTFVVRLIQSGLISKEQLVHKFTSEIHANEIVLLAYYVAAINVEETYHAIAQNYEQFQGIVLTDTFQMTEGKDELDLQGIFPDNNERVVRQNQLDIRVIIGNPPYSVGSSSANDFGVQANYPDLEKRIKETYVQKSKASLTTSLFDSYFKSFRWASDRIKDRGVIGFVTNGAWIDSNSADGFRASLVDEFTSIFVFNLRGNARTQGEVRRAEGGGVFGAGSRTPIAITILVKNPDKQSGSEIHYYDIGDYLSSEEKLSIVDNFISVQNVPFTKLEPNRSNDWINKRSAAFETYLALGDRENKGNNPKSIFLTYSQGIKTNRDAWVYNFSRAALIKNIKRLIEYYNSQIGVAGSPGADPLEISWDGTLLADWKKGKIAKFEDGDVREALYRPFVKSNLYYSKMLNNSVYQIPKIFPSGKDNLVIVVAAPADNWAPGALVTDLTPDLMRGGGVQCFPLKYYDESHSNVESLFGSESHSDSGISDFGRQEFRSKFGNAISDYEIFSYVYFLLNHPNYQESFAADLKKGLPKVPLLENFAEISKIGDELIKLHRDYEGVDPYKLQIDSKLTSSEISRLRIEKMSFGANRDQSLIRMAPNFVIRGIPPEAHDFKVWGRSPLEWLVDRYQIRTNPDSQILNDPNLWGEEHGDSSYLLTLIGRLVTVGVRTSQLYREFGHLEFND